VDAIMWLGYGDTFPKVRPDSWERAAEFHRKMAAGRPPKPVARLAVVRSYRAWALSSKWEDQIRNPADWMLQQLIDVWAVKHLQPYDVFEIPPVLSTEEKENLARDLKKYPFVVSTEEIPGAWLIGKGTAGQVVSPADASRHQDLFEKELLVRGWLSRKSQS
jgi:hypothetical protein